MTPEIRLLALETRMANLLKRLPEEGPLKFSRDPRLELCDRIIAACAYYNGYTVEQLMGTPNSKLASEARHMAWLLIRSHTDLSMERIGGIFRRDHGTICKGIQDIKADILKLPRLRHAKETLERELQLNGAGEQAVNKYGRENEL